METSGEVRNAGSSVINTDSSGLISRKGKNKEVLNPSNDNESKNNANRNQKTRSRDKKLPEKEFKIRSSLLTDMLERKDFEAVHNVILAFMVHYVICGVITDLAQFGSVDLGVTNIVNVFGKPLLTLPLLICLHLTPMLILYPVFRTWATCRSHKFFNSTRKYVDKVFYAAVGLIMILTFYIPGKVHFGYERIPLASAAMIVIEQMRIAMKMYAFTRTNVPRALKYSRERKRKNSKNSTILHREGEATENTYTDTDLTDLDSKNNKSQQEVNQEKFKSFDEDVPCPDFKKLVYFLYAPTLIYRDYYPRSDARNWRYIFWNAVHIFGSIAFYNLIHQRFGYVLLQDFGPKHPMTVKTLVDVLFCQFIVGYSACVLGWVILIHSTQNIFAELLRFGDRSFYKDWWNCTSMSEYHRTWNTPVQDFLYNYVYKEAWENGLGKKTKWLPALLVFSISNLFHEYAISFICQFFCPVMGIMFGGPGTFLSFLPNKKYPRLGNIFMHWSFGLGHAFIHMFYTMEHFARVNECPPAQNPLADFFIPRFLTCDAIRWS